MLFTFVFSGLSLETKKKTKAFIKLKRNSDKDKFGQLAYDSSMTGSLCTYELISSL